jgi:hypothetical protein
MRYSGLAVWTWAHNCDWMSLLLTRCSPLSSVKGKESLPRELQQSSLSVVLKLLEMRSLCLNVQFLTVWRPSISSLKLCILVHSWTLIHSLPRSWSRGITEICRPRWLREGCFVHTFFFFCSKTVDKGVWKGEQSPSLHCRSALNWGTRRGEGGKWDLAALSVATGDWLVSRLSRVNPFASRSCGSD